jgi:hypothetical protein
MRRRAEQQPAGQPPAQRRRQDQRIVNPTPVQAIRGVEQNRSTSATNQTSNRVVEYTVTRASRRGEIYQITVHPVAVNELMSTQAVIGEVMVAFSEAFRTYNIPANTRGYLSVQSITNQNEHALDRPIFLRDAVPQLFDRILEDLVQSNDQVEMADLDWKFTIDQSIRGGAPEAKRPSFLKGQLSKTIERAWQSHNVNCAAYALCSLMYTPVYDRDLLDRARELVFEMKWGSTCDKYDFKYFVEKYTQYRVTVRVHGLDRKFLCDYKGEEWDDPRKHLRLIYDDNQKHYGLYTLPSLAKNKKECDDCGALYRTDRVTGCSCQGNVERIPQPKRPQKCLKCGEMGKHSCPSVACKSCNTVYEKGQYWRCLVPPKECEKEIWKSGDPTDGSKTRHFAYDFESRIKRTETTVSTIQGFNYDQDGLFDTTNLTVMGTDLMMHEVDFVHVKSIEGGEEFSFEGDTCMVDFIEFCVTHNRRNNVFWAHNASGYDARFIFDAFADFDSSYEIKPLMRGGKLMELKIKGRKNGAEKHDLIFRDSMLHTPGSLASLAKDYCAGKMLKGFLLLILGFFPHMFDRYSNPHYRGQIPDIHYFDYSTQCKSKEDYLKFLDWHSNWHNENGPVYDLNIELKKYCKNDVDVLCCILKGFSDTLTEMFKQNPLDYTTAPSYAHNVSLTREHFKRELDPKSEDYHEKYKSLVPDDWVALNPQEYWFVREGLRGGRTDVRKIYHIVSDDDWARGVRIRYQDICSEYPWQQIRHLFPVGLPTIEIYDKEYTPCQKKDHARTKCGCLKDGFVPGSTVVFKPQISKQDILDDETFFGYVCATVDPPKNMIHPTLVHYDKILNKCVATCERSTGYFTSVEFKQALKDGYSLIKLHRFDRYKAADSKWREFTFIPYLQKMINSKNEPADLEGLARSYREKFSEFDPDFAEDCYRDILATHGKWGKNPAKKHAFKIVLNSGWGKHAENPVKQSQRTFNIETSEGFQDICDMFSNIDAGKYTFNSCTDLGKDRIMYKVTPTDCVSPNLHRGYLPAAGFVSAYGRLQLYEQLKLLGDRVLMNDTDSIVYIYDPELYNIPEGLLILIIGGLLGDWEVEDIDSKNGGIREFVGMGPKTYAIKCENGFTLTKAKGIRNSYAASNLVNFDVMKNHVLQYKAGNRIEATKVPTMNFVWMTGKGVKTTFTLKRLEFNFTDLKGKLNAEGYLLPFGYQI